MEQEPVSKEEEEISPQQRQLRLDIKELLTLLNSRKQSDRDFAAVWIAEIFDDEQKAQLHDWLTRDVEAQSRLKALQEELAKEAIGHEAKRDQFSS